MILFFDTETTGLYPGHIIQLSYILDYGDKVIGKNFYLYTDYIEPSASMVHKITVPLLSKLSSGKTFQDYADEILFDFYTADLIIAHNFKFDLNFLIAECNYIGKQFKYKESFDTMKYFTPILKLTRKSSGAYKYPKLSELCDYYKVDSSLISQSVSQIFGDTSQNLHEARFDTTALYLSVLTAENELIQLKEQLDSYRTKKKE